MVNPQASINALRAISALSLRRLLQPAAVMFAVLLGAGYVLTILLVIVFSPWWLLLLLVLLPWTLVGLAVVIAIRTVLKRLMPRRLSREEHLRLKQFVQDLVGVADRSRTPYPVMLFLIAKDVIRGRESEFLRSLIGDSKNLFHDFGAIQKMFDQEK